MQHSQEWWETPNLIRTLRKNYGDDRAKAYLRKKFKDPKNKLIFARVCFPHHYKTKSPQFHADEFELLSSPNNTAIAAPRGFAKSTNLMVDDIFDIVNANRHYIVRISDSYTQALEHIQSLQFELEYNNILTWIYGTLKTNDWAQGEFITSTDVKIVAKGSGMKVRGLKYKNYRPDKIGIDDLENDEAVANKERRDKLYNWFKMGVVPALAKGGKINVIGTILHTDSLLSKMISRKDEFESWNTKKYQAITNGESIWPEMWPTEELIAMRDNPKHPRFMGSLAFSQEMQNDPINERDAIVQRSWIKYQDSLPELKMIIITVDPSSSTKETADFFAMQCWGLGIDGNAYGIEKFKGRISFRQQGAEIRGMYHRHNPNTILIEGVAYQRVLKEHEKLADLPIQIITPDTDKRRRLIVVSKFFEGGRVYMKSSFDSVADEIVGFGSMPHDDEMDAAVYAISHLLVDSDKISNNDIFMG